MNEINEPSQALMQAVERVFDAMDKYHTAARFNECSLELNACDSMKDLAMQRAKKKYEWALEFKGMTKRMLDVGIEKTKGLTFPPTLGVFLEACKPTAEAAFYEAQAGFAARSRGSDIEWSCGAVYWAAAGLGSKLNGFGENELKVTHWNFGGKRWGKCFGDAMKLQIAGELPKIPDVVSVDNRLGYEPRSDLTKETADKVANVFKAKMSNSNIQTSWADRCKSLSAALLMVNGLNSGMHRSTLAEAAKKHIKTGKLACNDGVWSVGPHWSAS